MLDEKTMPKDVLFAGPGALDCDAAGNVYVMDFSDNNIKQFDASGKFMKLIGRKGQGPGEFSIPSMLSSPRTDLSSGTWETIASAP